jgi:hypothetical protein
MERRNKESVLTEFESEMLERSAIKVKHSAEASTVRNSEMRVMSLGTLPNEKRIIIQLTINWIATAILKI